MGWDPLRASVQQCRGSEPRGHMLLSAEAPAQIPHGIPLPQRSHTCPSYEGTCCLPDVSFRSWKTLAPSAQFLASSDGPPSVGIQQPRPMTSSGNLPSANHSLPSPKPHLPTGSPIISLGPSPHTHTQPWSACWLPGFVLFYCFLPT